MAKKKEKKEKDNKKFEYSNEVNGIILILIAIIGICNSIARVFKLREISATSCCLLLP